jgi:hypothetical protein
VEATDLFPATVLDAGERTGVNNQSMDRSLRKLIDDLSPLAKLIAGGFSAMASIIGPIVAAAAVFLQDLQVNVPEAFDENGNLRPDWEAIVEAKLNSMPKVKPLDLHTELATRKITINVN